MFIEWILAVFLLSLGSSSSSSLNYGPCNFMDTVNITKGYKDRDGNFLFDGIVFKFGDYAEYNYVIIKGVETPVAPHYRGCICKYRPCIRLCCLGMGDSCVQNSSLLHVPLPDGDERSIDIDGSREFAFLVEKPCAEMYKLEPQDYDYDKWTLLANGSLALSLEESETVANIDNYCLGQNGTGEDFTTEALLCYHKPIDPRMTLYPIGMLLSIPFLIATFCVYAFIPELRNLHGKCLMCYVFGLTILYLCLSAVQLDSPFVEVQSFICIFIGFAMYMSVLICFFWLNVMCYDIWSTFKGGVSRGRGGDSKRFLYYCLYAFGSTLLITTTVYILDKFKLVGGDYLPMIGIKRCWLQDSRMVELIYVYTPITIIMIINIVLYSITAYRIWRVQKETSVVRTGDSQKHSKMDADTDRFFLYLRLFIIMGATWCMESISWVFENSIIFYVSDILNCLQGVIIFFLFVWKPKVKKLIVRRYRSIRKLPPTQSQNMSNSNRTETSRISQDPVSGSNMQTLSHAEKPMLRD